MRFQLLDGILEQQVDRVVAVKNVSRAEEYLSDHFPDFAVLPGVMMLETMVQAGRRLVDAEPPGRWVLAEVRNLRYGHFVQPGQTLRVEVRVRQRQVESLELEGEGRVEDKVAVTGRFRLQRLETFGMA